MTTPFKTPEKRRMSLEASAALTSTTPRWSSSAVATPARVVNEDGGTFGATSTSKNTLFTASRTTTALTPLRAGVFSSKTKTHSELLQGFRTASGDDMKNNFSLMAKKKSTMISSASTAAATSSLSSNSTPIATTKSHCLETFPPTPTVLGKRHMPFSSSTPRVIPRVEGNSSLFSSSFKVKRPTDINKLQDGAVTFPKLLDNSGKGLLSTSKLHATLDVVKNDWVTTVADGPSTLAAKKPKKLQSQGDRFIPNRTANNISNAHVKLELARDRELQGASQGNGTGASQEISEIEQAYQEQVAEACGIVLDDHRILAFEFAPPSAKDSSSSNNGLLRRTVSQQRMLTKTRSDLNLNRRKVATVPEKVLDAPFVLDDYYLNLMDWSCTNLVAVAVQNEVYIWNADSGAVETFKVADSPANYVCSVSWSFDGGYLAVGTFDGDTQLWDIERIAKARSMGGHSSRVGALAWDKHILTSGNREGLILNHDVRQAKHVIANLKSHTNEVCGLKWRADGQQLASGGNDNVVNIWDAGSTVPKWSKTNHKAAVKALAWCPWQENLLATGGGSTDQQIHFWNTTTGSRLNTIDTGSQVTSLLWSKDHREILSTHGYPDHNILIHAYPSLEKVANLKAHDNRILVSSLGPDRQTVATLSAGDETLKCWKVFELRASSKAKSLLSGTSQSSLGRVGSVNSILSSSAVSERERLMRTMR